ncbi:hypothetical protein DOT_0526 [Desulfosporosinus sp. OT]|nr:hypothetical protein DOT_0526 [Desulfosporosinus sp. OT]
MKNEFLANAANVFDNKKDKVLYAHIKIEKYVSIERSR